MSDLKNISAALVKAQRAFGPAIKDRVNPAFKSKYADLGACLDAVMDALNAAGIALVQRQHPHEGGVCIETLFVHESGEQLSAGMLTVPAAKQDPQGYGSALSYARRYSLMAACGIAPEDDDGNAAKAPPAKPDSAHGQMDASKMADWLGTIGDAAADELDAIAGSALKAAEAVRDPDAYRAIRAASNKRRAALDKP